MRKIYEFYQLSMKARKKAAEEVYKIEVEKEHDWSIECEQITEWIMEKLNEEGLHYNEIYWDTNYGVSLDLSSVRMRDEYLKAKLDENEMEIYNDLNEISGEYMEHRLFDANYEKEGYVLDFEYPSGGFDELEAMTFVMKHTKNEEIKNKYKFPLLMEEELASEAYEELESDLVELAEGLAGEITAKIDERISEMVEEFKKFIRESCDYMGSEAYYLDALSGGAYEADVYRFNLQGEVILRDGEFVNWEFEDKYYDEAS